MSSPLSRSEFLRRSARLLVLTAMGAAGALLFRRGQIALIDDPDCPSPCADCADRGRCRAPQAAAQRALAEEQAHG